MPRKLLRYSLTALSAAALLAVIATEALAASQQPAKVYIGRNDGRVQQNKAAKGLYIGRNDGTVQQNRAAKGFTATKGSQRVGGTPAIQLNRYSSPGFR